MGTLSRSLVAIFGSLRQHFVEDLLKPGRDAVRNAGERRRVLRRVPQHLRHDVRIGERRPSRHAVIQHAAEAVNVRANVGRAGVLRLLGSHVIRRADHRPFNRQLRVDGTFRCGFIEQFSPEADVHDSDGAFPRVVRRTLPTRWRDHQVRGLDIAVNHASIVQVLEAVECLAHEPDRLARGKLFAARKHFIQRLAFEELHDDEVPASGVADLEGAHHIRVIELGQESGFALEAAEHALILRPGGGQDFEGDHLAEGMDGLVDAAHLAFADLVEDLVAFEEEAVGAAALHHGRLPGREYPPGNEVLAEGFDLLVAALRLVLPPLVEGIHFFGGEQLALGEQAAELGHVGARSGHENP